MKSIRLRPGFIQLHAAAAVTDLKDPFRLSHGNLLTDPGLADIVGQQSVKAGLPLLRMNLAARGIDIA